MLHSLVLGILLFTGSVDINSTSSGDWSEISPQDSSSSLLDDSVFVQGVEAFYRTDWETADSVFSTLKEERPEDPMPWFFSSMMPFWEYFFIEQTPEKAAEFLEDSEIAVELSEQRLDRSPSDTTMVLLLSGLHGYRSLVAAGENEYRVAISSGMAGFNYTRKLLSLGSDRPDARIGRGMFYYMVGSIPREMRWASNLVGFRADVDQGFEELKKAAESDSHVSADAKMMLMYLYNKEQRFEESIEYAEILTDEFPENIIFKYKAAEIFENAGQIDRALAYYESVTQMDNPGFDRIRSLSNGKIEQLKTNAGKD
jgi:tetratricopeptide (TPR) repeat protein